MELQLYYSTSLLLLLLLLPSSSSSHGLRSADGTRALHYRLKDPHPPKVGEGAAESLIGSRPPRCDGKCAPCGRCEAVQVPVAPRVDSRAGEGDADEPRRRGRDGLLLGSVDEESYTDYKPLNWRCRCADRRALDP
ncbi:hypothetical protein BDA96_01G110800 [Sorghum bicolor]|uniref:Epidermal patterning factor-like protein n=2 Tax=Sorghum bicolor TaxID=4558 RepID=A0A921RZ43_SORBI|nr:EPIDERMAL PATTERNING FACTOR-like protein 2 [Sorghum bicolor]EER90952.1 hypothetical protein SORBI_3001G106500 [Sorghum bicolor]KAG0547792.1 hypothetical protein BDA96_01G110800 [Sorghum bicolor]|eukprot:XP_002463954.1 EPIDERMAL PATTERNING FACTOR-like protein 2 [Sorghum bicolor]